jgi:hypothetical protein
MHTTRFGLLVLLILGCGPREDRNATTALRPPALDSLVSAPLSHGVFMSASVIHLDESIAPRLHLKGADRCATVMLRVPRQRPPTPSMTLGGRHVPSSPPKELIRLARAGPGVRAILAPGTVGPGSA